MFINLVYLQVKETNIGRLRTDDDIVCFHCSVKNLKASR